MPTSEYLVLENFWKICTYLKIFGLHFVKVGRKFIDYLKTFG